ncbi:uncharacterized protein DFL_009292 [Arthrobotrys flagrans]|uniref:Oxidoreductase acuF-like C2H2 type zinc-finger domain-containing protein n=1 Tax=Arthrobotrys flagrans TaxID=97331 RepID=A0A436ZR77_ARTFL|nr:hypothetical protein DFL_009292 [Arthrobotrys flagrans]
MDELFQAHQSCRQRFANLATLAESPIRDFSNQVSRRDWEIEVERYKIWASSVGVGYSGENYEKSLDYGLRDASFMRSQVALILKLLIEHIENAIALLKGERVPWEDMAIISAKLPKYGTKDTELSHEESEADTGDDSPWDFSSDDVSINGNSLDDCAGENDSLRKPEPVNGISNIQSLHARTRIDFPAGEMAQIRHAIQTTISSLYGLPIRKATIQHRLRGELPEEVAPFESLDISYVRNMFPELAKASPEVATRLGKLITRRREILHSRKTRDNQPLQSDKSTPARRQKGPNDALQNPSWLEPPSYTRPAPAPVYTTDGFEVVVPRRPLGEDGEELEYFMCPYCCTVKEISSKEEWKAHVFQDLQPYVCTYPNCELGDFLFESREQWFQHELAKHRVNWFCNTKGHDHFNNKADFSSHMAAEHSNEFKFNEHDTLMASKLFAVPANETEPDLCTLCMKETAYPESHVGWHLEILALRVIPAEDFRPVSDHKSYGSNNSSHIEYKDATALNLAPTDKEEGPAMSRDIGMPDRKRGIERSPKFDVPNHTSTSSSEIQIDSDSSSTTSLDSDMAFGSDTHTTPPSSFSELHSRLKSWARRNISGSKRGPTRKSFPGSKSDDSLGGKGPSRKGLKRRDSFDFNIAFGYSSSDSSDRGNNLSHRPSYPDITKGGANGPIILPDSSYGNEQWRSSQSHELVVLAAARQRELERVKAEKECRLEAERAWHLGTEESRHLEARQVELEHLRRREFDLERKMRRELEHPEVIQELERLEAERAQRLEAEESRRLEAEESRRLEAEESQRLERQMELEALAARQRESYASGITTLHDAPAPPLSTARKQRRGRRESLDSNLAFGGSSSEGSATGDMRKSHIPAMKKGWRWWRTGAADATLGQEDHNNAWSNPEEVS